MKKRTVRQFTHDSSVSRSRFFGDELLSALDPGKLVCLGTVWAGVLAPRVDAVASAVVSAFVAPGLSVGNVLHAEPAPETLDMGRAWVGDLHRKIGASLDAGKTAVRRVDVSEVLGAVERLGRDLGTGSAQAVADGVKRLRVAADKVSDSLKGQRTGDSRSRIASINEANHQFNASRSAPQVDSSGRMSWHPAASARAAAQSSAAIVDAATQAAASATPRERLSGMNQIARSFWATRA